MTAGTAGNETFTLPASLYNSSISPALAYHIIIKIKVTVKQMAHFQIHIFINQTENNLCSNIFVEMLNNENNSQNK